MPETEKRYYTELIKEVQADSYEYLIRELVLGACRRYVKACDLIEVDTWKGHVIDNLLWRGHMSMGRFTYPYEKFGLCFTEILFPGGQLPLPFETGTIDKPWIENSWHKFFREFVLPLIDNDEFVRTVVILFTFECEIDKDCSVMRLDEIVEKFCKDTVSRYKPNLNM